VTSLELRLQIPGAALARSRMRINAGSFQVGVPQGGRNECDGCAGARTDITLDEVVKFSGVSYR